MDVVAPAAPPRVTPKLRRIIGGLAYDTETASTLHHWMPEDDDPLSAGNYLGQIGEVLMQNVHGYYFVASYNNHFDPWEPEFEKIEPKTLQAAIAWAEQRCNWLVEELFGRMPEPGEGEPYVALTP